MPYIFVDCEAPFGVGAPSVGDMTKFGAVEFDSEATFYGPDCSKDTFANFSIWIKGVSFDKGRPIFVSDNPAYDWQWINFYYWLYFGGNPFGHSARRIGDFYAGLVNDFQRSGEWKKLRVTTHDHNPVNDAMGNVEAVKRLLRGERP